MPSEMMYEGTEILGKTLNSLGCSWNWVSRKAHKT